MVWVGFSVRRAVTFLWSRNGISFSPLTPYTASSRKLLLSNVTSFSNICGQKKKQVLSGVTIREKIKAKENNFAYDYFCSKKEYCEMILVSDSHWGYVEIGKNDVEKDHKSFQAYKRCKPVVQQFIDISLESSEIHPISHPAYQDIVSTLVNGVRIFTQTELKEILYHLSLFPACDSISTPEYKRLWQALDEEVTARYADWCDPQWFTFSNLFFRLRLSKFSSFHLKFISNLYKNSEKLSKKQFVWFVFCINLVRRLPHFFNSYDLEKRLHSLAPTLTSHEIVIIAMGFFKSQTAIKDNATLSVVLQTVTDNLSNMDDISLASVSKLVRYCGNASNVSQIMSFQEKMLPVIETMSISTATHIALSGTRANAPNITLIEKLRDKVIHNIKECRLKELERVLLAMSNYGVQSKGLCEVIMKELESGHREEEKIAHGRCLSCIAYYLTLLGYNHINLISQVLSQKYLNLYYETSKPELLRELTCLDLTMELEDDCYSGNRMKEEFRDEIVEKLLVANKRSRHYENGLHSIESIVKKILNAPGTVYTCSIIPQHFCSEVMYCTDSEGHTAVIPLELKSLPFYKVKFKPKEYKHLNFHAIWFCNRGMCVHNSHKILGQGVQHVRQLNKMGYHVETIYMNEWILLPTKKREELVENILNKNISRRKK